jgi:hypothetical protein
MVVDYSIEANSQGVTCSEHIEPQAENFQDPVSIATAC